MTSQEYDVVVADLKLALVLVKALVLSHAALLPCAMTHELKTAVLEVVDRRLPP